MSTTTRDGLGALLVLGVGLGLLGWFSAGQDPDPEDRRVEVEFEVSWGVRSEGEIRCDGRDIRIRYAVAGRWYDGDPTGDDSEGPCHWARLIPDVPVGDDLALEVTEVDGRGWKSCSIYVDGRLAVPNGQAIARFGDPCRVSGVAI